MSRILLGASAAAMMLAASALSPVIAQSAPSEAAAGGPASIGTLTCGDITGLSETDASALIYYSAGYQDGLRDSDMSGAMDADNADNASADKAANSAAGGAAMPSPIRRRQTPQPLPRITRTARAPRKMTPTTRMPAVPAPPQTSPDRAGPWSGG